MNSQITKANGRFDSSYSKMLLNNQQPRFSSSNLHSRGQEANQMSPQEVEEEMMGGSTESLPIVGATADQGESQSIIESLRLQNQLKDDVDKSLASPETGAAADLLSSKGDSKNDQLNERTPPTGVNVTPIPQKACVPIMTRGKSQTGSTPASATTAVIPRSKILTSASSSITTTNNTPGIIRRNIKVMGSIQPTSSAAEATLISMFNAQNLTKESLELVSAQDTKPLLIRSFKINRKQPDKSPQVAKPLQNGEERNHQMQQSLQLNERPFQVYPSQISQESTDEFQEAQNREDLQMRLSQIKVHLRVATNCLFEIDLESVVNPNEEPLKRSHRIKLLMSTQPIKTSQSHIQESREGPRIMIVRVALDAERLRGKWQTLFIDLDKILASKLNNLGSPDLSIRFKVIKFQMTAPDTNFSEIQALFQPQPNQPIGQSIQQSVMQRNNASQVARSMVPFQRKYQGVQLSSNQLNDSTQATEESHHKMQHFKSPQTASNFMGRTAGCSFTTTATSLNGNSGLAASTNNPLDQSSSFFHGGKRRSVQQQINGGVGQRIQQQERSRDAASANSVVLKTPQSITSTKGVTVIDQLPPLFSNGKPKVLSSNAGELNIIHERLPFSQTKPQQNSRKAAVNKSTSVVLGGVGNTREKQHSSQQQSRIGERKSNQRQQAANLRSTNGCGFENQSVSQQDNDRQSQNLRTPNADQKGIKYLEKLNERQKRMEQRYFKKETSTDPSSTATSFIQMKPQSSHQSTNASAGIRASHAQTPSHITLSNQRPQRLKMINNSSNNTNANASQNGTFNRGTHGPKRAQDASGQKDVFIDFKKSCATFSSTLRNYQEDYQFLGGAGRGPHSQALPGQSQNEGEEAEESIHEEIDQSLTHNQHLEVRDTKKRPPLNPQKISQMMIQRKNTTPSYAGTEKGPASSSVPYSTAKNTEELQRGISKASFDQSVGMANIDDLRDEDDDDDDLYIIVGDCEEDLFQGGYPIGAKNPPGSTQAAMEYDALSNKTATSFFMRGPGLPQQSAQRSFSPPFKM